MSGLMHPAEQGDLSVGKGARQHERLTENFGVISSLRLRIKLVDKTGNVELEYHATQRDLPKAQKWAKAFQILFVDALMEDADLDITITRKKGNLNLVV